MFVAVREIKVGLRGKPGALTIPAGGKVPDDIDWPYDTLAAQVSVGNLRWEGKGEPELNRGTPIPKAYRDTNLSRAQVESHKASEPKSLDPAEPKAVEPKKPAPKGEVLECCGAKFKTKSGYSAHKRAKHAAQAD